MNHLTRKEPNTGYTACPCRDCFEISMDHDLCSDCAEAGCEPNTETECQSPYAYEGDDT